MGKLINLVDTYMRKLAKALFCGLGYISISFFSTYLFNWI